jgi:hypothetical protein
LVSFYQGNGYVPDLVYSFLYFVWETDYAGLENEPYDVGLGQGTDYAAASLLLAVFFVNLLVGPQRECHGGPRAHPDFEVVPFEEN